VTIRQVRSTRSIRLLAAVLAVALASAVAAAASTARAAGPAGGTPAAAGIRVPGALGGAGWQVLSSAVATQTGQQISTPGFGTGDWLRVANDDAGAPGSEIGALLQNGKCANVFFSDNLRRCFGYTDTNGPVTVPQFAVPWWYRTDFTAALRPGQVASITVNGVVGAADVWVDGKLVATRDTVTGAYTRFTFDVTGLLRRGTNTLALKVYPNDPSTMFTLDDVDWNQIPPDNNTGIQFPVQLRVSDALSESNAHVVQANAADLSRSALTVKVDVTNNTGSPQAGVVTATVTPPAAAGVSGAAGGSGVAGGSGASRGTVAVSRTVTVAAHQTRTVTFAPADYPALTIAHPQVWWPYQMGPSPLYRLDAGVAVGGTVLDTTSATFGIRTVTSTLVGPSAVAPDGVRSYTINGRRFVVRGGGFAPDLFLRYSAAGTARQLAVIKNLGLNVLRPEGHFLPDDFYQQADAAGLLIDAGFQCCDAWEPSGTIADTDLAVMRLSALTIAQHERNHPSVFTFGWSDNAPLPAQENVSLQAFAAADFDVPIVASAEYKSTAKLGASGEKEGPYDYVPPSYWYDNTHVDPGDDSRTNAGGSWGLDSEQSAGDTVPTVDSIRRFLSPAEQDKLWQDPGYNQYHLNYEPDHGGYAFGTLFVFDQALTNRYGSWSSLDSFVAEAQLQNYENTRAQFEAFLHHSTARPTPATGTIYWQANKGWPSLLWNLYNQDGDQAGAFFGAKKANAPLHALYGYDDGTVTLDNLGGATQSRLSVESKVYDLAGNVLDDQRAGGISLASQQVRTKVLAPKVPAVTAPPAPARTYFVELLLRQGDQLVDRNVYWMSTQRDVVDWSATLGNPQATMTQYANLQALRGLPASTVKVTATSHPVAGPDGADRVAEVTVTNTSGTPTVGFFLRADLRRGDPDGTERPGDNQVGSALWSDNDITLWPGESQTLTVSYRAADLAGAAPVVTVSGWNAGRIHVPVS
jgi:exo-1,4-beta-D-glucosaminidase